MSWRKNYDDYVRDYYIAKQEAEDNDEEFDEELENSWDFMMGWCERNYG